MDFITILSIIEGIVVAILGGGWFLNWKAAKKKPELENNATETSTQHEVVTAANEATQIAIEELHALAESNKDLTERNRELRDEIDDLKTERGIGTMLLCRNTTCPLRSPEFGLGPNWFDALNNGELEKVMDSRAFEEIAAEKGYKLVRIKKSEE